MILKGCDFVPSRIYFSHTVFLILQLKAQETKLKIELTDLNKEYEKLDARVGLLGHKSLLADYSQTQLSINNVKKNISKKTNFQNEVTHEDEVEDEADGQHQWINGGLQQQQQQTEGDTLIGGGGGMGAGSEDSVGSSSTD